VAEVRGLGHQFLRHVERARALCVLIDLAWEANALPDPAEQERVLLGELEAYQPDLLDRPRVVAGSRADLAPDADGPALRFSSVTREGLSQLTGAMADAVREVRQAEPEPTGFVVHRPLPSEGVLVDRDEDGSWRVHGRAAERAVALSDLTQPEALEYADHRLKSLGVDKALARAGARNGETVRVGRFEFEYRADDEWDSSLEER
jgi:GTPase